MSKEDFIKGMKVLGQAYGVQYTSNDCELWYEFIGEYSVDVFKRTIKNIIKTSKFAPKIADIVQGCEEEKEQEKIYIIEYMSSRGYFGQASEKEKAILFVTKNNIPSWLKEDMQKYYDEMRGRTTLTNNNQMLLNG
jgi:hypothetical protein